MSIQVDKEYRLAQRTLKQLEKDIDFSYYQTLPNTFEFKTFGVTIEVEKLGCPEEANSIVEKINKINLCRKVI